MFTIAVCQGQINNKGRKKGGLQPHTETELISSPSEVGSALRREGRTLPNEPRRGREKSRVVVVLPVFLMKNYRIALLYIYPSSLPVCVLVFLPFLPSSQLLFFCVGSSNFRLLLPSFPHTRWGPPLSLPFFDCVIVVVVVANEAGWGRRRRLLKLPSRPPSC